MLAASVRRASLGRSLVFLAAAALSLATSGCAALLGVEDTDVEFLVKPQGDGSFFGWTEITIEGDTSSASSVTLLAVTLDVARPAGTPDLSFLQDIEGEAVKGEERTLVVTGKSFPRKEQAVALEVAYAGDLSPFFDATQTLRFEWTGHIDPTFTAWPPDGFWVHGLVKVEIE